MNLSGTVMEHFLLVTSVRKKYSSHMATFGPLTHGRVTLAMLSKLLLDTI